MQDQSIKRSLTTEELIDTIRWYLTVNQNDTSEDKVKVLLKAAVKEIERLKPFENMYNGGEYS